MTWVDIASLAILAWSVPVYAVRARRMGIIGALMPQPMPPTSRLPPCCEHNPCPTRPDWFPHRFQKRPWRCPSCSTWWVTFFTSSYGGGFWSWKKVSQAAGEFLIEDLK